MHGTVKKPPLVVVGMFGIGDCIGQRAMLRELMKTHDVWLETYYASMYHDLIAEGLNLRLLSGRYSKDLEPNLATFRFPPARPRGG